VAARFGIARINAATLAEWQAQAQERTLYVFDVRDPVDYEVGHLPGMKNVPGGQLVQETDRHAATWGARVVLVDDDGVRAVMTAHWMKQMGWDAAAMTVDMRSGQRETGAWPPHVLGLEGVTIPAIDAAALRARMQAGNVTVVDVDWSRDYIEGHIPGAWYGIRSRLNEVQALRNLPAGHALVFTSADGALAKLAASDWLQQTPASVLALSEGNAAWRAAGYALEAGATHMVTAPDDIRLRARDQGQNVEEAMRAYLSWEIELVNQMASDDDQRFRVMKG
jgi:rhodanese-related sulfurtransferase